MEDDHPLRIFPALQKSAALDLGVNSTLLGEATEVAVRGHYNPTRGLGCPGCVQQLNSTLRKQFNSSIGVITSNLVSHWCLLGTRGTSKVSTKIINLLQTIEEEMDTPMGFGKEKQRRGNRFSRSTREKPEYSIELDSAEIYWAGPMCRVQGEARVNTFVRTYISYNIWMYILLSWAINQYFWNLSHRLTDFLMAIQPTYKKARESSVRTKWTHPHNCYLDEEIGDYQNSLLPWLCSDVVSQLSGLFFQPVNFCHWKG